MKVRKSFVTNSSSSNFTIMTRNCSLIELALSDSYKKAVNTGNEDWDRLIAYYTATLIEGERFQDSDTEVKLFSTFGSCLESFLEDIQYYAEAKQYFSTVETLIRKHKYIDLYKFCKDKSREVKGAFYEILFLLEKIGENILEEIEKDPDSYSVGIIDIGYDEAAFIKKAFKVFSKVEDDRVIFTYDEE